MAGERAGREMKDYTGIPDLEIIKMPPRWTTAPAEVEDRTAVPKKPLRAGASLGMCLLPLEKAWGKDSPGKSAKPDKPVKASSLAPHGAPAVIQKDIRGIISVVPNSMRSSRAERRGDMCTQDTGCWGPS